MVTIFLSNMDTSVRFYTDVLGLKLEQRWGATSLPSFKALVG